MFSAPFVRLSDALTVEFYRRAAIHPQRLGVLAGAFNPVTVAHLALARAALFYLGPDAEVTFVLPKLFPHKPYHGAPFADRLAMLQAAVADEPNVSIAAAEGGLFLDIAAECHEAYGPDAQLTFLCGRDAADRVLNWNYDDPDAINQMFQRFNLLVAARGGDCETVPNLRHRVEILPLNGQFDHVSSTEVRDRIAQGAPWEHLVPEAARELVRQVYQR
jgi:nicotinate-nucleotide adenylyltransferase